MNLIVLQRNVVLEDRVPLLEADLLWARANLRGNELLEVANEVVLVALDPDLREAGSGSARARGGMRASARVKCVRGRSARSRAR